MFFDFHTHRSSQKASIFNIRWGYPSPEKPVNPLFSIGIHPWDAELHNMDEQLRTLSIELTKKNIIALGEIGLDKVFGTNLGLQREVFVKQIHIANEFKKKVLIIHCVKSFDEILVAKQKFGKNQIWVIHGFNGGSELLNQLDKAGFYFSLGIALFNPASRIAKNIDRVPLEKVFLETDDSDLTIEQIYRQFAQLRNLDLIQLQQQIDENLTRIFGDSFLALKTKLMCN